jgi:hypothetical protein
VKNLAHNASFDSELKGAPSKPGIKHLERDEMSLNRVGIPESGWI